MRTIILSIGDELILGQIADANSAWLSARLVELGIVPEYHQTVPDDLAALGEALKTAAGRADLVIATGGLGPTLDDLTRQAVAQAAGMDLVFHEPSFKKIGFFFRKLGRKMSANNRVQAMIPRGAKVLDNPAGTAPGFSIKINKAKIVVLPGVPKEMKIMFERHIAPVLAAKNKRKVRTLKLNVFGLGESMVAEKLGKIMQRGRNPLVGTTASGGAISIRIRGEFENGKDGARKPALPEMRKTADKIKRLLGDVVFSEGDVALPEAVGKLLLASHKTIAVAESCTAGLLSAMLTEMAGSSKYFLGGWVVYSNRMKTENLDVPDELIRKEGAVSAAVAKKMAEQTLSKSGADYALAITGIAGPQGGTPEKPVGTIWIALAGRTGGGISVSAQKLLFSGDRAMIRDRAAKTALNILRLRLMQD